MNYSNNEFILNTNDEINEKELYKQYFIKYQGSLENFKKDVNDFLSNTLLNLTNLNQSSTIGDIFSFIKLKLEEKFSYDSALISLFNYALDQEKDGKWSQIQLFNYSNKKLSDDKKFLIVTIPLYCVFLNDYTKEHNPLIEVNCVISSKLTSQFLKPVVLENIKYFFNQVHSLNSFVFPTTNNWDDLRILDLYSLLGQSLLENFHYENIDSFNKLSFRFILKSENNKLLYLENYLLSKSCFLSDIKINKSINFPIRVYFDGNMCFETNLMLADIFFIKEIDWEKKWEIPFFWLEKDLIKTL